MNVFKILQCQCKYKKVAPTGKEIPSPCPKCGSMMKLSDKWSARYTHEGKTVIKAVGSKKEALDYLADARVSVIQGIAPRTKEAALFWEDGLKAFDDAPMKDSTREYYKYILASMSKTFYKNNLCTVTPDRLSDFIAERKKAGWSARTQAGAIGAVKRMFTLVVANRSAGEYRKLNEAWLNMCKLKKPAVKNLKDDFFTAEEVKLLVASSPVHLALAIRIQIETGLRPGNVYSLQYSEIGQDGTISLEGSRMKSGKPFVTSISAGLLRDIKKYQLKTGSRKWLFPSDVPKTDQPIHDMRSSWKSAITKAGLTGTPHKLRHSFASILIGNDVPIAVISELLQHSDISITMTRYAHLEQSKKQQILSEYRAALGV